MILDNKPMARSGAGYDWDDYYGYDEIVSFMEGLAANDDDILEFIDAVASAVAPDRTGNLASVCSDSGGEWLMEMLNSPDQWAVCSSPDP